MTVLRNARSGLARLCDYNNALLGQAVAMLQEPLSADGFAKAVGPHLRHVIEHYETLLGGILNGVVDYESRARNHALETDPRLARERCESLIHRFDCLDARLAGQGELAIDVVAAIGLEGDADCLQRSTVARELLFLASHTTHHYAIMKPALLELGVAVSPDFGKAPGTIRHERPKARRAA
jgi:hypothetical protein